LTVLAAGMKDQLMNAVRQTVGGTNDPVPEERSAVTETTNGEMEQGNNDRRATEVGPVLEEILRSHWQHWGLND